MGTTASSNSSSTASNVVTVLLLIFFLPIGVIVMWFWPKWNVWVKVVITILGILVSMAMFAILSTVALFGLGSAQKAARDAQRVKNINAVRVALEKYFSVNNSYPFGTGVCNKTFGIRDLLGPTGNSLVSKGYMAPLSDPLTKASLLDETDTSPLQINGVSVCGLESTNGAKYYYSGGSDGKSYKIVLVGELGHEQDFVSPQ